ALRADQNGIDFIAGFLEHRAQKRVLVFAVAVLIAKDLRSLVWLKASDTEREAYVAVVLRNEVVDRADLLFIIRLVFGQFRDLGFQVRREFHLCLLQAAVPRAYLLPVREGRHRDVREPVFASLTAALLLEVFVALALRVVRFPGVDAAVAGFFD